MIPRSVLKPGDEIVFGEDASKPTGTVCSVDRIVLPCHDEYTVFYVLKGDSAEKQHQIRFICK